MTDSSTKSTVIDIPVEDEAPFNPNVLVGDRDLNYLENLKGINGIADLLKTDPSNGICDNSEDLAERSKRDGKNYVPPPKTKSILQLMLDELKEKMIIILIIAAVVSTAMGIYQTVSPTEDTDSLGNTTPKVQWVEGVAIIVAIIIIVLIGSINNFHNEKQFKKLTEKNEERDFPVIRNGETTHVSIRDILLGDVIKLETGDIVPVDAIVIGSHDLKADESSITGESKVIGKQKYDPAETPTKPTADSVENSPTYGQFLTVSTDSSPTRENQLSSSPTTPTSETFLTVPSNVSNTPSSSSINTELSEAMTLQSKTGPDPFIVSGSRIVQGRCTALVVAIGPQSFLGKMKMSLQEKPKKTPLQEKLNDLAELISKFAMGAGALMLVINLILYGVRTARSGTHPSASGVVIDIFHVIVEAVTVIVVAVPEGLPLAVLVTLAYSTFRMLKDNNLVRKLASCETMGGATVICTDKTGTLTQNKMTVMESILGTKLGIVQRERATNQPSFTNTVLMSHVHAKIPLALRDLVIQSIVVNSTADIVKDTDKDSHFQFFGNKTEEALLNFATKLGLDAKQFNDLRAVEPTTAFPFSSERKSMLTVIPLPHPSRPDQVVYRAFYKGASEVVLQLCKHTLSTGRLDMGAKQIKTRQLEAKDRSNYEMIIRYYANKSFRTITLAYRDFDHWPPYEKSGEPRDEDIHGYDLTFIGIVGIQDPLRQGVPEAVLKCNEAGVRVIMVTGDNPITATSIAKECHILSSVPGDQENQLVMTGPEFRILDEDQQRRVVKHLAVLARSSPDDKKTLVKTLQANNETVAVTGDGTNDAPALQAAHVGFSMGIAGTDIAKEASSIVLMDDNFSSIINAIKWGRCVNDAVRKFLQFQLTVNITAVLVAIISSVVDPNQKSVLTATQLLWVNLIMDTLAALALATDPPSPDLLQRKPQGSNAPLISITMWKMILIQAIFQLVITLVLLYTNLLWSLVSNPNQAEIQTVIFNTFVFCQLFNELNCRRIDNKLNFFQGIHRNWMFIGILFICVLGQCIIVNFAGIVFQAVPIRGEYWGISIAFSFITLPIGCLVRAIPDEVFKIFLTKKAIARYYAHEENQPSEAPKPTPVQQESWAEKHDTPTVVIHS